MIEAITEKQKQKKRFEPKWLRARDMVLVFFVASCLVWVCFGFHSDGTLMVVHRNLNLDIENGMNTSKPRGPMGPMGLIGLGLMLMTMAARMLVVQVNLR